MKLATELVKNTNDALRDQDFDVHMKTVYELINKKLLSVSLKGGAQYELSYGEILSIVHRVHMPFAVQDMSPALKKVYHDLLIKQIINHFINEEDFNNVDDTSILMHGKVNMQYIANNDSIKFSWLAMTQYD